MRPLGNRTSSSAAKPYLPIYVTTTGSDANEGLTPATAVASFARSMEVYYAYGGPANIRFADGVYTDGTYREYALTPWVDVEQTRVPGYTLPAPLILTGGMTGAAIASGAFTAAANSASLQTNLPGAADAYVGCFVHVTSGPSVGQWAAVMRNTGAGLLKLGTALNVANGNTLEIRKPSVRLVHEGIQWDGIGAVEHEGIWFDGSADGSGVGVVDRVKLFSTLCVYDAGSTVWDGLYAEGRATVWGWSAPTAYAQTRGLGGFGLGQQGNSVIGRLEFDERSDGTINSWSLRSATGPALVVKGLASVDMTDTAIWSGASTLLQVQDSATLTASATSTGVEWFDATTTTGAVVNGFAAKLTVAGYVLNLPASTFVEADYACRAQIGVCTGTVGSFIVNQLPGSYARVLAAMTLAPTAGQPINLNGSATAYATVDAAAGKTLTTNGATVTHN